MFRSVMKGFYRNRPFSFWKCISKTLPPPTCLNTLRSGRLDSRQTLGDSGRTAPGRVQGKRQVGDSSHGSRSGECDGPGQVGDVTPRLGGLGVTLYGEGCEVE